MYQILHSEYTQIKLFQFEIEFAVYTIYVEEKEDKVKQNSLKQI